MKRPGWWSLLLGVLWLSSETVRAEGGPTLRPGAMELSGTTALEAGNGTRYSLDGFFGYFITENHEVGAATGLVLDDVDRFSLAPGYQFNLVLDGLPALVPFAGAQAGIVYVHISGRDTPHFRTDDTHDVFFMVRAMGGGKIIIHPMWAIIAQVAVENVFDDGLDPTVTISGGFSVFL